jgi:hypothetical protein
MLSLPLRERREYRVYRSLLGMVPGLEERLLTAGDEEMRMIADLVSFFGWPIRPVHHPYHPSSVSKLQKGTSSTRSDDTKSLKSAVLDWITPRGESLSPPIARNVKSDRGFNHEKTGFLLCPAGLDWSDNE